jgi:uncharacterized membrane protein (DUF441 family)
MSFKEFMKYSEETKILKTVFISLLTSFVVLIVLYFLRLNSVEDFLPKYGFYLFFIILSYAFIMPAVKQVKIYKEFSCMTGMMIGMTIGMIAGFLPGFFLASTNGMFYGSVFGMVIGVSLGIWNGKCCGIMGIMEGTMAGFMGGLMGAMTAIMMYNDNLKAAGIIIFAISSFILFGLNYLIYKESRELEKREVDEFFNIALSLILTSATIWFMAFGPRSLLFG